MTTLLKWLLVAGIAFLGAIVSTIFAWQAAVKSLERQYLVERQAREAMIQPLVKAHVARDQVTNALGLEFVDYSVGTTKRDRDALKGALPGVRDRAGRFPGVLFHTTAYTMTWLFFDSEGRLQDYYLCRQ